MNFITHNTRRKWIKQIHTFSTKMDQSDDFSCMDRFVENKKIVLLGESSHGIAEYYTTKIKMINYLHEKHGFNVVVLESGLLEGVLCKTFLDQTSPREQIQQSLLDIFHNEEMVPLFKEPWFNQIHISGMDIQPTYPYVSNALLSWIQKNIDDELYRSLVEAEQLFFEIDEDIRGQTSIPKKTKQELSKCIEKYQDSLELTNHKIKKVEDLHIHKMLKLVLRGIENRIKWCEINQKSFIASGVQRGRYMFDNLKWLIEDYYAGEKMIVWAHNFHIRKSKTITSKLLQLTNVGQLLKDHYDEEIYSVGFYAGKGKFSSLLRVNFSIVTSKKNHLENILLEAYDHNCFVPLSNIDLPKRSWLDRRWWLLEAGLMGQLPIAIFPKKHYDAIMFCREVTPPTYFNSSDESAVD